MEQNQALYISADNIEPTEVQWLWYPYIPFGKVSILQGDPGDGKSTFMLKIAAMLTAGKELPFTEPETEPEPMKVIYQTTEDDASDTIVPRFMKAGGNRSNLIFIMEDEKPLTFADERIEVTIRETGAKLLILDPLSSYIGDCSINSANEVRPQFNHLVNAAKETGCAIVIIDHMNKMRGTKGLYRTVGSIDIVGAVRSLLTIIRNPEEEDKRYMVLTKANLAPLGSAISFSVSEDGIEFLEEVDAYTDDLLESCDMTFIGRPDEKTQEAMDFIREMLSDGRLPATECKRRMKEAGIKESTAKKAKRMLGVVSTKQQIAWTWHLP